MNRRQVTLTALCGLCLLSGAMACNAERRTDRASGGDSFRHEGRPVTVDRSATDQLDAEAGDHTDWKQIEVLRAGRLEFVVRFDDPQQLEGAEVVLVDELGEQIDRHPVRASRATVRFETAVTAPPVRYHLRLFTRQGRSVYTVAVRLHPPAPEPREGEDDDAVRGAAPVLLPGATAVDALDADRGDAVDWKRIPVEPRQALRLRIRFDAPHALRGGEIRVYDEAGVLRVGEIVVPGRTDYTLRLQPTGPSAAVFLRLGAPGGASGYQVSARLAPARQPAGVGEGRGRTEDDPAPSPAARAHCRRVSGRVVRVIPRREGALLFVALEREVPVRIGSSALLVGDGRAIPVRVREVDDGTLVAAVSTPALRLKRMGSAVAIAVGQNPADCVGDAAGRAPSDAAREPSGRGGDVRPGWTAAPPRVTILTS